MKKVLERLKKLNPEEIDPNTLKAELSKVDFSSVEYMDYLKGEELDSYFRVSLMDFPVRVFLNVWPAQFQLPAHQHKNFWGYIAVLKGLLTETSFVFEEEESKLSCHPPKSFRKGEVVFEPLNVIHHLQNPSPSKPLVTAHFYFPTVTDYNGVKIFDIRNRRITELNEKATSISLDHPEGYYREVKENAFSVVNLW